MYNCLFIKDYCNIVLLFTNLGKSRSGAKSRVKSLVEIRVKH